MYNFSYLLGNLSKTILTEEQKMLTFLSFFPIFLFKSFDYNNNITKRQYILQIRMKKDNVFFMLINDKER